jgi:prefoldin subunit 5
MQRSPRSFVTALAALASLILFIGSLVVSEHATAQNPKPTTPPDTQDCESAKAKLNGLLDLIDILQTEVRRLQATLDELDRKTQEFSEFRQGLIAKFGLAVDDFLGITDSDKVIRDLKAAREKLRKEIIDDEDLLRNLNQEIRDVVNKLGTCTGKTDDATKQFDDCLQKQGAERNLTEPERAHNPKTGQNLVWDKNKKSWIDAKTGECVCPKCPASNPNTTPSPKPSPTSNPTPTPANNANNQVGYHAGTNTANGLVVTTFDTPQGKIKVNLPDDMAAGDTISGTVE